MGFDLQSILAGGQVNPMFGAPLQAGPGGPTPNGRPQMQQLPYQLPQIEQMPAADPGGIAGLIGMLQEQAGAAGAPELSTPMTMGPEAMVPPGLQGSPEMQNITAATPQPPQNQIASRPAPAPPPVPNQGFPRPAFLAPGQPTGFLDRWPAPSNGNTAVGGLGAAASDYAGVSPVSNYAGAPGGLGGGTIVQGRPGQMQVRPFIPPGVADSQLGGADPQLAGIQDWVASRGGLPKWAKDQGLDPSGYAKWLADNPDSIGFRTAQKFLSRGAGDQDPVEGRGVSANVRPKMQRIALPALASAANDPAQGRGVVGAPGGVRSINGGGLMAGPALGGSDPARGRGVVAPQPQQPQKPRSLPSDRTPLDRAPGGGAGPLLGRARGRRLAF